MADSTAAALFLAALILATLVFRRSPVAAVWTADFKEWWRGTDGRRCELLTIRDKRSHAVLAVRVIDRTNGDELRRVFEALFERHGWPQAIQTESGSYQPMATSMYIGFLREI